MRQKTGKNPISIPKMGIRLSSRVMTHDVQHLLQAGAALTDQALERLLPTPDTQPHSIHRAMRHSTFAGGKRLRPILCLEAARMVAGSQHLDPQAAQLGAALEMIHTYSLIHDDLPALDNDDLRRGQPTCHVVFGEAIAILAGDALQILAFQVISRLDAPPATVVAILRAVSDAISTGVGPDLPGGLAYGMIGGQVMDLESEGVKPSAELVERIHRSKTGALITVSVLAGGLLGLAHTGAHAEADTIGRLRTFGEKAGLAFQIVDDVLDMTQDSAQLGKTAGKDTASDKATWPAIYASESGADGIAQSLHDAQELIDDAFAALQPFGPAADPLKSLATYLTTRTN
jgi:geranylgeranyl diphosphate synthase type II